MTADKRKGWSGWWWPKQTSSTRQPEKFTFDYGRLINPEAGGCATGCHALSCTSFFKTSISQVKRISPFKSTMAAAVDTASELLIAQLLEDDLRVAEEARQLEQAQLEQSLKDSALLSGKFPKRTKPVAETSDVALALAMLAADVRMSSDAAYAQALQHSDDAASIASRQYAQQLLAAEKKVALDVEFARRLQQLENSGDIDENMDDAERVLGRGDIERIMVSVSSAK